MGVGLMVHLISVYVICVCQYILVFILVIYICHVRCVYCLNLSANNFTIGYYLYGNKLINSIQFNSFIKYEIHVHVLHCRA